MKNKSSLSLWKKIDEALYDDNAGALSKRRRLKSQSAMEYLMTYGWAILIIAVVLGALFTLGLFNSANLAPKSPPGSCQVLRSNGPGTTSYINTEGVCNNGLPQYVAQFNGASSYINLGSGIFSYTSGNFAVSFWAYDTGGSASAAISSVAFGGWPSNLFIIYVGDTISNYAVQVLWNGGYITTAAAASTITNGWHFFAVTDNGGTMNVYIDGANVAAGSVSGTITAVSTFIGAGNDSGSPVQFFPGDISNVQVYNVSLSQNEITSLYDEGIGGAPTALPWLVGWWPLNENANDYSGNLNNGVSTNVVYTNSWTSRYSAP